MRFLSRVLLAGCVLVSGSAMPDEVRVAVAGNFLPVLTRFGPDFGARSGHELRLSPGATGKLHAQIVNGAPFDVFLAADRARPEALEHERLIVPGSRATYALGRLALWAPRARNEAEVLTTLRGSPSPRVAIANPRLAPYGEAARAWLEREDLWRSLSGRAVRGESVAQAYHFVASGNADLGFVALSQLRLAPDPPEGAWWLLPSESHPAIEQQLVLLNDTEATRAFVTWLLSPSTQARLRNVGYGSP